MTAESLFSPDWFRVAHLRPALGEHVQIRRHSVRGSVWHLLVDTASGRQTRLNDVAYQFVGRCNGRRSVHETWENLLEQLGDDAPTQGELLHLIGQLVDAGMLRTGAAPDAAALFERQAERERTVRSAARNPLSFRLAAFDPGPVLQRLDGLAHWLFRPWALPAWLVLVGAAVLVAGSQWDALRAEATTHLAAPRFVLLVWLVYPFIKAVHELAHGMAVRRWGGEVPRMGITLLVLVPAPYVDAAAASAFAARYQRMIVSAAGIMAELLLAALALFAWTAIEAGTLRDLAFVIAFVGGVSTVLFNGNPLLRFDGYYLLADALDLPNLGPRSAQYWIALTQRRALGLAHVQGPEPAPGERRWLLLYAPLAWLYKLAAGALLVFWAASLSFAAGAALGLFLLFVLLGRPLFAALRFCFFSPVPGNQTLRVRTVAASALLACAMLLGLLPLPATTVAEGIVWMPERAELRAETDGFVVRVVARDGERVHPGQLIAMLDAPELEARRRVLESELAGSQAAQFDALLNDPLKARNADEAMRGTRAELARIEERLAHREVRARVAGRLVMPRQADLPGSYLKQGALLGYVLDNDTLRVRTVVEERDIAQVRAHTAGVSLMLADGASRRVAAQLGRDTPAATHSLPSPALGDQAGGACATDPTDKSGTRSLAPVFVVDLVLPRSVSAHVGSRAWVHFAHGAEPLAAQWSRRARQLFLRHFAPSA